MVNAESCPSTCRAPTGRPCTCPGPWSSPPNQRGQRAFRSLKIQTCFPRPKAFLRVSVPPWWKLTVCLLRFNRRLDCLVHLRVAGAAAQISAQRVLDLFFAWLGITVKQRLYRDHESRCAETALRAAPVAISFLDGRQRAVI